MTTPQFATRPVSVLRRRAGWIYAVAATVTLGAWGYAQLIPVSYVATAGVVLDIRLLPNTTPVAPAMSTEKALATSGVVIDGARATLGPAYGDLRQRISVGVPADANLLQISCQQSTPSAAQNCARVVAQSYIDFRNQDANTSPDSSSDTPQRGVVAELITPPSLPAEPSGNSLAKILALAVVTGLALGIGTAFLRDLLSDQLRSRDELARLTGAPVLSVVPHMPRRRRLRGVRLPSPERVVRLAPGSTAAEAFRYLRARLESRLGPRLPGKVITVTSAKDGAGCSTVAVNLAAALVQNGSYVVIIDADLNRPQLPKLLGASDEEGLAEAFAGETSASYLLQTTATENLHLLSAGLDRTHAVDLMNKERLLALLADLSSLDTVIIFDAGPVLGTADIAPLAEVSDIVLLVVSARTTTRTQLLTAYRELTIDGLEPSTLACVLNNVPRTLG